MALVPYDVTLSSPSLHDRKIGARQKPLVDKNLEIPYERLLLIRRESDAWGGASEIPANAQASPSTQEYVLRAVWGTLYDNQLVRQAYAKAYDKLFSKVGERASLLTALAERKSTASMVLNRLTQLYRGAKALRKGRFREFCKTFGIKPKDKHKDNRWSRPRDFSSLWLEYWFGWAPTIADVGLAIDVWQSDLSSLRVRVASGNRDIDLSSHTLSNGTHNWATFKGKFFLQLRAKVEITNPDLWVANNLGFLNPVKTAWETTPFSWFADWFTNVGQVLGSFTDQIGCKISDVWCTRFCKGVTTHMWTNETRGAKILREVAYTRRYRLMSVPRPSLIFKIPGISWTRGLTLSSLLVQLFSPRAKA